MDYSYVSSSQENSFSLHLPSGPASIFFFLMIIHRFSFLPSLPLLLSPLLMIFLYMSTQLIPSSPFCSCLNGTRQGPIDPDFLRIVQSSVNCGREGSAPRLKQNKTKKQKNLPVQQMLVSNLRKHLLNAHCVLVRWI